MQTLQRDETLIAELFDALPEAVLWYTPVWSGDEAAEARILDFELQYCNAEAIQVLGIPKERLIGQRLLQTGLVNEEAKQQFFRSFLEVWQTGKRKTSSYMQAESNRYLEAIRSKVKGGILSVTRDRTKEHILEQEHKHDRDLLSSILDASINGLFAMEAVRAEHDKIIDFRFLKVTDKFSKVVGLKEEDIIGKSYLSILSPSRENGLFDLKCRVVETGEPFQKEFYYKGVGIDGWYNISMARLGTNGVVETFTDITESKRNKEQLERSAARLTTVINSSQAGIFTLQPVRDETGTVTDFRFGIVNESVAAYIGQTAGVLRGSLASIYFPAYTTNGLFDFYKETYTSGKPQQFDFHYGDGYDNYFNISVCKMDDEVLVTFTDHTNLKRLQNELESRLSQLQRSNESLEEFAYAASHDLQEPLRKIRFFSERLKRNLEGVLSPDNQSMLDRMEVATLRMRSLIEDLLAYSRASIKPDMEQEIALNDVVHHVLQDLETRINETGAVLNVAQLPVIRGDERQLRQLFQNVIGNALKYRKQTEAPRISVLCRKLPEQAPELKALQNNHQGSYFLIEVRDNGIGFEQEYAQKIFQVFQRLHGRSEFEGTGVGLAIAQKVAMNHNGLIVAKSEPGQGATFSVLLPAAWM